MRLARRPALLGRLAVDRRLDVLADDPAVRDGVLAGEVRRWLPLIGDMAAGQRAAANVEAVRRVFAAVEARGDPAGREARWAVRWAVYRDCYAPTRRSTKRRAGTVKLSGAKQLFAGWPTDRGCARH